MNYLLSMKHYLQTFKEFLGEAADPTYYQETFYFMILISMSKDLGGSRDETKNDIRAIPEVLTVTLVEPEKGGVQRDIGTKYLSTLKLHVRRPKGVNKTSLMKKLVLKVSNLRGISVLRYKEHVPKTRRKQFYGQYKIDEGGYQDLMHQKSGEYEEDKEEYLATGPQKKGGAPFKKKTSKKRGPSAPPIVGSTGGAFGMEETASADTAAMVQEVGQELFEAIRIKIRRDVEEFLAFALQDDLNQKIWDGNERVRPGVRGALLDIVDEFVEGLELDAEVKDVVLTGSLANYNWSKFSDIDLHILIDFSDVNENEKLVKKFFDAVRSNWNKLHDIMVKGHEVEIYVQDENEAHVSTGVYSLLNDRWIVKPKKVSPNIDEAAAKKKMLFLKREVDKLGVLYDNNRYEEALELAQRLKEKIKSMRRTGLERSGLFSSENLAFKMLRRSGDLEKLFSIFTSSYDAIFGLDENHRAE